MKLLYQTIVTHLLVAVPPAVALGYVVTDINRDALTLEAQRLHLATAGRVADSVIRQVDDQIAQLEIAERTLDLQDLPFDRRLDLVRARIASGTLSHVAVFNATGALDSLLFVGERPTVAPPNNTDRSGARTRGRAISMATITASQAAVHVYVPWQNGDEIVGFLGANVDLSRSSRDAEEMALGHLGETGAVEIGDRDGRVVVASQAERIGSVVNAASPLFGLDPVPLGDGAPTGRAMSFVDPEGAPRLGAVLSVPRLGWWVATSRAESVAFESLLTARKRTLALALIAAFGAGLIGLLLARRLSNPMARLAASVRRSAKTGFSEPVQVRGGPPEVQRLGTAFNAALSERAKIEDALAKKTRMQLRLARHLSPTQLHALLTSEMTAPGGSIEEGVTVLYADVVSSDTQLESNREVVDQLAQFYERAVVSVQEAGGHVDRFSGDALIGVFSPKDHAQTGEAALAAAQDILRATFRQADAEALYFSASVGVSTGAARVQLDPEGASVEGALVERAAELIARVPAGSIGLDESTRASLRKPPKCSALPDRGRESEESAWVIHLEDQTHQ